MKRKGISPVLATIILLAVTVAVGVAVASYVFGLFGSYSAASAIKIQGSPTINSTASTFNTTLVNNGGQSDAVGVVTVVVNGTALNGNVQSALAINGGGGLLNLNVVFPAAVNSYAFIPGTTYQVKISFNSGAILTTTIVAS